MWRNKKNILITLLVTLSVVTLILVGGGCTKDQDGNGQTETETEGEKDDTQQAGDGDESKTEVEPGTNGRPDRIPPQMDFDGVAKILGIDPQELENAYIQARNELADSGLMGPPPGGFPEGMGPPPEGFPEGMGPPMGGPLPEPLLARMAEILKVDQQELADAFAQVQGSANTQ